MITLIKGIPTPIVFGQRKSAVEDLVVCTIIAILQKLDTLDT